jgi:hypothetical protein
MYSGSRKIEPGTIANLRRAGALNHFYRFQSDRDMASGCQQAERRTKTIFHRWDPGAGQYPLLWKLCQW